MGKWGCLKISHYKETLSWRSENVAQRSMADNADLQMCKFSFLSRSLASGPSEAGSLLLFLKLPPRRLTCQLLQLQLILSSLPELFPLLPLWPLSQGSLGAAAAKIRTVSTSRAIATAGLFSLQLPLRTALEEVGRVTSSLLQLCDFQSGPPPGR